MRWQAAKKVDPLPPCLFGAHLEPVCLRCCVQGKSVIVFEGGESCRFDQFSIKTGTLSPASWVELLVTHFLFVVLFRH